MVQRLLCVLLPFFFSTLTAGFSIAFSCHSLWLKLDPLDISQFDFAYTCRKEKHMPKLNEPLVLILNRLFLPSSI